MGYTFKAKIKSKTSPITPDDINLVSFGIRKGEEIEDFNPKKVMSTFESIRGKYNGMMAGDKKFRRPASKKPLTFSWTPLSDVKPVFLTVTSKALNITITITDQETKFKWEVSFDDVVLSRKDKEVRTFPPDNYRRNDDRFEATFLTFVDAPK